MLDFIAIVVIMATIWKPVFWTCKLLATDDNNGGYKADIKEHFALLERIVLPRKVTR